MRSKAGWRAGDGSPSLQDQLLKEAAEPQQPARAAKEMERD